MGLRWILVLSLLLGTALAEAQNNRWRITRTEWSAQDEARFGEFIARIGAAVERRECATVADCLRSYSANPYAGTDPASLRLFADCADLPYYLRSYFAWKNGLPMSIASGVRPRQTQTGKDVRYSRNGNIVTDRYSITAGRFSAPNAVSLLNETIVNAVYSATFRVMGDQDGNLFSDFYPVKLSREAIRPGTVIYDPNGHVAIIHRISDDGRIFYIDSHPDNTLTSGMYTPKFVRSNPYHGAGFKNFRPLYLMGARRTATGEYTGGKIVGARNNMLPHFSYEQFYGNTPDPAGDWQKGKFIFHGTQFGYYDYLRIMMSNGNLQINPIEDLRQILGDICTSLKDRVVAVDQAIQSGIDKQEHPLRLPLNIYGADGDWEAYATPSRDARLKVSYMDLLFQAKTMISRYKGGDPNIIYYGRNLAADMLAVYERESRACQFSYTNSSGSAVTLDLENARARLFDISFDPYHCVELRWGAKTPQELSSCQDSQNKRQWYAREKWLRNQWERRYDARMDFSLEELNGPKPGAGIAQAPDVDIVSYLQSQQ
ncbi:hypothetical protein QJS83_05750 [Bdellovibrio sp. 22V]|uniref:hypothetical protein n=1 Tax=Bdellovibrio TaxID=958 RepID=UPI002543890F|nr:hypothetical protein [Bdellovibrio sp. 22V]WII73373.1 hypothetical protein QJS83_05750 [Bdellovibrio sp. 22V]